MHRRYGLRIAVPQAENTLARTSASFRFARDSGATMISGRRTIEFAWLGEPTCQWGDVGPRLALHFRSFFALVPRPPGALTKSQDKKDSDKGPVEEGAFLASSSDPRGKKRLGCQCPGRNAADDRQHKTMHEQ